MAKKAIERPEIEPVEVAEESDYKDTKVGFEQSVSDIAMQLAAQPKRTVRVVKDASTRQAFVTVCINGHIYQIMRGVEVEVPQTVYDVLDQGGYI